MDDSNVVVFEGLRGTERVYRGRVVGTAGLTDPTVPDWLTAVLLLSAFAAFYWWYTGRR